MRVTFHGHACVAVDHEGAVVVLDPGSFSDAAGALADADAVLLTHEHPDHVDSEVLGAALAARPELAVWAPEAVAESLRSSLPDGGGRVHVVAPGDGLDLGGLEVVVGGGRHAVIHPDVPRIANVTYLLRSGSGSVFHPGDSFDLPPGTDAGTPDAEPGGQHRLDVLLAPVSAPWLKLAETIDFVRAVDPAIVVPVHDALLSAVGHGAVDRLLGERRTGGTYEYRPLAVGESVEVPGRDDTARTVAAQLLREHPEFAEVHLLEHDETVPPRPEEDVAAASRDQGDRPGAAGRR